MKIIMRSEENLEFRQFNEPGLDIEPLAPEFHYSALQMFATSLAMCTYSVLFAYGEQVQTSTQSLTISLDWTYAKAPMRVNNINMNIQWPGLPSSRLTAAQRAASLCTLHQTLENPPHIVTNVANVIKELEI
jgi:uncharacterized OsmC-like protein